MHRPKRFRALCAALACACTAALSWAGDAFDTSAGNLIAVLRQTPGANQQEDALQPFGKVRASLPDGREVEIDASWFQYLGDIHVRLVFDSEREVMTASPDDLQRLQLDPQQAMAKAVENLRRRYGTPVAKPWSGGLMQVEGSSYDLNSSYFLDRDFWLGQASGHPDGLVVSVPARGGLVFAPADDEAAVTSLRFSTVALYTGNRRSRISSALYLFKDGHWSVYEAPQQLP
jgi:hypothetical protein